MALSHLSSTLQTHCRHIENLLADYKRMREDAHRDLIYINGTIEHLERVADPSRSMQAMSLKRIMKRGQIFEWCSRFLSENPDGLDTTQLARLCLQEQGMDLSDRFLHRSMAHAIAQVLDKRLARGQISTAGKRGVAKIWQLK